MKKFSGSAVSRYRVFVLADGTSVVQWDDKRVQELLSGRYRHYEHARDFGHAITDYELNTLKASGRVEHYTPKFVWLYALPERGRYARRVLDGLGKVRGYYLTTAHPKAELPAVVQKIEALGLAGVVNPAVRGSTVVLYDQTGMPFHSMEDAERAQDLVSAAGDSLKDIGIAFIEIRGRQRLLRAHHGDEPDADDDSLPTLDDLIASQQDVSLTAGRKIALVMPRSEECEAFTELFNEMHIQVHAAQQGEDALGLLEDVCPDLIIMDLQLPDMHGYQLLGRVREVVSLRELPVLIIADEPNLTMTIAKVDYLTRPVSIARLRFIVWKILRERISDAS